MSTPLDKRGYMFTESYGPKQHYRLVIGFESLDDLHAAQDFILNREQKQPRMETGVTRPKEVQPSGSPAVEAVADEAAGRLLPCGCDRARTAKWVRRQCGCLPLEQDLRGDPTDI